MRRPERLKALKAPEGKPFSGYALRRPRVRPRLKGMKPLSRITTSCACAYGKDPAKTLHPLQGCMRGGVLAHFFAPGSADPAQGGGGKTWRARARHGVPIAARSQPAGGRP